MQKSIVKEKLAAGRLVLVPKICFMDPNIVETLGLFGFDCAWICNEYKAIDPTVLENMVRAGRASGIECIIRTGVNSFDDFSRFLAMGANGLMIPHVQTPQHARRAVDGIKYPPLGHRELEDINADANFGLMPLNEYLKAANDETVIVVQIEDMEAIERVEEIAEVQGIDVLFVGPADLALNLGVPGQCKHPKVLDAIRRVIKACEARNLVCGTPAIDPEHCKRLIDEGVRYLTDGSDWRMLTDGFRRTKETFGKLGFSFREPRPAS
jgi:2-keto-3-deoxy-L-rhamnonate aldolase RhmA